MAEVEVEGEVEEMEIHLVLAINANKKDTWLGIVLILILQKADHIRDKEEMMEALLEETKMMIKRIQAIGEPLIMIMQVGQVNKKSKRMITGDPQITIIGTINKLTKK